MGHLILLRSQRSAGWRPTRRRLERGRPTAEEWEQEQLRQRLFQSVSRYGGRYFNASTARDLELASRTLDRVEKGVLVSRPFVRDAPVYDWFAVPALVCLALAIALRAVPFFIDQT